MGITENEIAKTKILMDKTLQIAEQRGSVFVQKTDSQHMCLLGQICI